VNVLGIILARAGSRGLPNKCVAPLLGRPLVEYTIDHACESSLIRGLLLTTDSPAAREVASARGVVTIQRPAELATDTARVDAAARHAVLAWEDSPSSFHVDAVVLLYANIPVRAEGILDRVIDHLRATGADSVRTVASVGRHHPDWLHRLDGDRMSQFRPNGIFRRQDLEPLYYHDGAGVAVRRGPLFEAERYPDNGQAFLGSDRRAIVCRPDDAVDVDEPLDLLLAEAVLRSRGLAEPAAVSP